MPPKEKYKASVSNEIRISINFYSSIFPATAKVVIFFELKLSKLIKEQRAKSKDQRSKIKEQRAKSKDQRAKIKEQRAKIKEQRAKSKEQRSKIKEQEPGIINFFVSTSHHLILTSPHCHITTSSYQHIIKS
jgi:hypothetical protein